jgi:hypothetical protein
LNRLSLGKSTGLPDLTGAGEFWHGQDSRLPGVRRGLIVGQAGERIRAQPPALKLRRIHACCQIRAGGAEASMTGKDT